MSGSGVELPGGVLQGGGAGGSHWAGAQEALLPAGQNALKQAPLPAAPAVRGASGRRASALSLKSGLRRVAQ
jgi:hypothetical protein